MACIARLVGKQVSRAFRACTVHLMSSGGCRGCLVEEQLCFRSQSLVHSAFSVMARRTWQARGLSVRLAVQQVTVWLSLASPILPLKCMLGVPEGHGVHGMPSSTAPQHGL